MKKQYEENPFENAEDAERWITSVESEKGWIRDNDIYPTLKKWSEEFNTKKVLEVGCGQGICSSKINYNKYVGIDPSKALIRRAMELYDDVSRTFFVQSVYDIQFSDKSFDAVFSVGVWFHLENIIRASQEIARVLLPEGKFLIITGTAETFDAWENFYKNTVREGDKIVGIFSDGTTSLLEDTFYLHSNNEISRALLSNGCVVTDIFSIGKNNENKDLFTVFEGHKINNSREGSK